MISVLLAEKLVVLVIFITFARLYAYEVEIYDIYDCRNVYVLACWMRG